MQIKHIQVYTQTYAYHTYICTVKEREKLGQGKNETTEMGFQISESVYWTDGQKGNSDREQRFQSHRI